MLRDKFVWIGVLPLTFSPSPKPICFHFSGGGLPIMEETRKIPRCSSSPSPSLFLLSSSLPDSETKDMQMLEHAPPFWRSVGKKKLSK
ncbi:hypothetical protein Leryth_012623 [Lithospermum erythrorhizon]|nr:hypothetical protein Leryth_012623 [Lithospermum erythrorhizon]